jgi:hypothetical protein
VCTDGSGEGSRTYRRTVPFPPVRTAPAIFMSLSLFICRRPTKQRGLSGLGRSLNFLCGVKRSERVGLNPRFARLTLRGGGSGGGLTLTERVRRRRRRGSWSSVRETNEQRGGGGGAGESREEAYRVFDFAQETLKVSYYTH